MNKLKTFCTLILLVFAFISNGQDLSNIQSMVSYEYKQGEPQGQIDLFLGNSSSLPISMRVNFTQIAGAKVNSEGPYIYVIPPNTQDMKAVSLTADMKSPVRLKTGFEVVYGDITNFEHEDNYVIPYEEGESFLCGQGFNGSSTHSGYYAIDFNMPVGTAIHAAKGGTVIKIKEDSNKGCANASCESFANLIEILHEDGSLGLYIHLKHNGVDVEMGQKIEQGQLIGYSGNTGWSSGPHLHFHVLQQDFNGGKSIPFTFLVGENNERQEIKKGQQVVAVRKKIKATR